jgi:hypothetical protein
MTRDDLERVRQAVGNPVVGNRGEVVARVVAARIDLKSGGVRCMVQFPCGHRRVLRENEIVLADPNPSQYERQRP